MVATANLERARTSRPGPGALVLGLTLALLGSLAAVGIYWGVWTVVFFGGQAVGLVTDAAPRMGLILVGAVAGLAGGLVAAATCALCLRVLAGRGVASLALAVGAGWVVVSAVDAPTSGLYMPAAEGLEFVMSYQ